MIQNFTPLWTYLFNLTGMLLELNNIKDITMGPNNTVDAMKQDMLQMQFNRLLLWHASLPENAAKSSFGATKRT